MRVGAVLLVVAAVAAVTGTFLELYALSFAFPGGGQVHTMSSWEYLRTDGGFSDRAFPPRFGLPISVASVVAVVGAVFLLRGRERGRLLAVGGVAGMAAAVWAAAETYLSTASAVEGRPDGIDFETTVEVGSGLLVMIGAVVVAAVGLVLVLLRKRVPEEEADGSDVVIHQFDDTDEVDTPPYGIPVQEKNA